MTTLDKFATYLSIQSDECPTAASYLAKLGTPSTSIAILDDGTVSARCFSTVGDDVDTVFQAASISKSVTALAVMKLIDEARLSLDGTVGELVPADVVDALAEGYGKGTAHRTMVEGITIKQLMSHTAGLSTSGFIGYSVVNKSTIPTAKQVILGGYPTNTPPVRLENPPGHTHSYSGGGITVLQVILEEVTGKSFATLMQDLVLGPLGMTRSSFHRLPSDEKNAAKAHFTGDVTAADAQHVQPEQAAAGLYTTPTDLLKVIAAVQDSLDGVEGALLKSATARTMLTVVREGMALGWVVPMDLGYVFGHSGANEPGFQCYVMGFADMRGRAANGDAVVKKVPKRGGICVMTNSQMGVDVMWRSIQYMALSQGWPKVAARGGVNPMRIPFALPLGEMGTETSWQQWKGTWREEGDDSNENYNDPDAVAKKDRRYVIEAAEGGAGGTSPRPVIRFGSMAQKGLSIALLPAAAPEAKTESGEWRLFVVEGMSMMILLEEKDDKTDRRRGKDEETKSNDGGASKQEIKLVNFAVGEVVQLVRA
ncbi:hypothetical protein ACSS6W_009940 [Trichoderma asperelloides]|uniref:Protein flp n=1 Tax=Trichoderma asperellum TaxID=101201 RepID=A0A6V8R6U4_TRIAP|nr:beta-lactamase/transpeptidase-like protein [Trichoderma asperelloides]GFP60599.1 protein flp [Trichoderma asperellum]